MKNYKIGFFGKGSIFLKHYDALKKNKSFLLFGVYDKNKSDFKEYKSKKNILESKHNDIIGIVTPSGCHFDDVISSLMANKHVIVEKPLALQLSQVKKIAKLEKKIKKNIFVVFQHRINSNIEIFKKKYQKKIGKVFLISTKLYWCRNNEYYNKVKWRGTWKQDGGVVTNQGIHTLDLILTLFGDIHSVYARSSRVSKYIETEDVCIVSLKLKNGILCNMEFTTAARPRNIENSITFLGEKGFFKIGGLNLNEYSHSFSKKITKLNNANLHQKFYKNVYNSIHRRKKNIFSANSCVKTHELLTGIYQSIKLKKEITFPLNCNIKIPLGI